MVGGKGIYNQVSILTYLEISLLQLDDQINILPSRVDTGAGKVRIESRYQCLLGGHGGLGK